MNDNGVSVRHSSETAEHYTPPHVIEAARTTLGGFDLDPFSCETANRAVRAECYFAEAHDGFSQPWHGRVFVNPPGGRGPNNESNQKRAWFKSAREYLEGRAHATFFVCFSVELLQTTQVKTPAGLTIPLDWPICYPSKRLAYTGADGTVGGSPPHSSCLILIPSSFADVAAEQIARFKVAFAPIGRVVVPAGMP